MAKKILKRDFHKCIWTSSYDRGLEHLLDIWSDVKKAIPDATLEVAYGWTLFEQFYRDNPERMGWLARINQKMKQPGITHHGRVSQPEIEKWYKRCGILAYPTDFYEINFISGIKAQAFGAVPVVMDYAALKETIRYGIKVKGDIYDKETKEAYKQALIKALKDDKWQEEQRAKMMPWARENYPWDKIAKDWTRLFTTDELKEAAELLVKEKPEAENYLPVKLQEKYGFTPSY